MEKVQCLTSRIESEANDFLKPDAAQLFSSPKRLLNSQRAYKSNPSSSHNEADKNSKENVCSLILSQDFSGEPLAEHNGYAECEIGLRFKRHRKLGLGDVENFTVKLAEMGFGREIIEPAVFCVGAASFEELVHCISKSEEGKWNHKFLSYQMAREKFPNLNLVASNNGLPLSKHNTSKIFAESNPSINFTTRGIFIKNNVSSLFSCDKSRHNAVLDVSQVTTSTNEKELCFICGDILEEHSPDYNIELMHFQAVDSEPVQEMKAIALPEADNSRGNRCMICFSSRTESESMKVLPCGHYICKVCLRCYLVHKILKERFITFKCPYYRCGHIFSDDEVKTNVSDSFYFKTYLVRRAELLLYKLKRLLYCPFCSRALFPRNCEENIVCSTCGNAICTLCQQPSHKGLTCAENLAQRYRRVVRGWKIQTCPRCRAPTRASAERQHAVCPECLAAFCVYCRRENTPCAGFKCSLPKLQESSHKKPYCPLLSAMLLTIIVSPLLAVLLAPYIVVVNVYRWLTFEEGEDWGALVAGQCVSKWPLNVSKVDECALVRGKYCSYSIKERRCPLACTILVLVMVALLALLLSPITLIVIITTSIVQTIRFLAK